MSRASPSRIARRQAKTVRRHDRFKPLHARSNIAHVTRWPHILEVNLLLAREDRALIMDAVGSDRYWNPDVAGKDFSWCLSDTENGQTWLNLHLPGIQQFHSHRSDNRSVILSGGYTELRRPLAWDADGEVVRHWRKGDVIERAADEGHSIELSPGVPYCLTRFELGPVIRSVHWVTPFGATEPVKQDFLIGAQLQRRKEANKRLPGRPPRK